MCKVAVLTLQMYLEAAQKMLDRLTAECSLDVPRWISPMAYRKNSMQLLSITHSNHSSSKSNYMLRNKPSVNSNSSSCYFTAESNIEIVLEREGWFTEHDEPHKELSP